MISPLQSISHAKNRQGTKSRASQAGRYTSGYPFPADRRHFSHQMPWRAGRGFTPHQRPRDSTADRRFYARPRRAGADFGRRPVSVSSIPRCTDGSSGLVPDLCSRGVRPILTLTDGAGGLLPGVPLDLGCLGMTHQKRVGPGRWCDADKGLEPREGNSTSFQRWPQRHVPITEATVPPVLQTFRR